MIFERYTPAYPLCRFVESFIYYRDYDPVHRIDRFLPDGNVNIVVDLTDYPKYIYDNNTLKEIQSCRNVWFSGIRNKFISIPSGKDSEMFVINFHKGMAYPFVQMPLHELTDSVVDGELVLTYDIMNLREKILEAEMISQKFYTVEQYLLAKFGSKLVINPFVAFAVDAIRHEPGHLSIKKISDKVGYSQKHLISIFREHVGLTPKSFLKVMRFQKAIDEIASVKQVKWTDVALESGYYDQAHFINDFRDFSGFTPKEYLLKQYEYLNYIPVD